MGLTISYILKTNREIAETTVLQFAEHTATLARQIGCVAVTAPEFGGPCHWKMWELPDGSRTGEPVSPLKGYTIEAWPGEGCEPAAFGLCQYPGVSAWKLSASCNTQYAARYGVDHFLHCHRRIISLLDLWRDFGIDVCDEGEYWETRSLERLKQKVTSYDRMVAAVAGQILDDGNEGEPKVKAEIFNDSRFEHLEAQGRAELALQLAQLKEELDKLR